MTRACCSRNPTTSSRRCAPTTCRWNTWCFPTRATASARKPTQIAAWHAVKAFLDQHLAPGSAVAEYTERAAQRVLRQRYSSATWRAARSGNRAWESRQRRIAGTTSARSASSKTCELARARSGELATFDARAARRGRASSAIGCSSAICARVCGDFKWRRHDYLVTQMGGIHRRIATTLLNESSDRGALRTRRPTSRVCTRVKPLLEQLVTELRRQERPACSRRVSSTTWRSARPAIS